nr:hypothetical protein [Tanacetum cinerariifolium]
MTFLFDFSRLTDLLKHLDREGLNQLWRLVKETLSNRPPTSDKEMELWVELSRLYEPDHEDQLWTHTQNFIHAPVEWKLYDSCGVHYVTSTNKEIFMLVEKDYPLNIQDCKFSKTARNKMHKAFPLPGTKFPLAKKVSTASEEEKPLPEEKRSHCQEDCTAIKVKKKLSPKTQFRSVFVVSQGPLNGGNCLSCSSVGSENEFVYDLYPYSYNETPNFYNQPPHHQYEMNSCEFCGNDAHYGYDCSPKVPFVYNQDPCYNQNGLSEDLSDIKSECDVPICDDFMFSNLLFDADDDFSSSDDESFSDEDVPKKIYSNPLFDEEIISIKTDPHHFNADYDLIESLLNQGSLIISSPKIDSLLKEFSGELAHIDLIPLGINEADFDPEEEIRLAEKLFDSLIEEIYLFLTPDDSMPPGIENDDYDSEGDIIFLEELLSIDSHLLPENESFHFDIPSSPRPLVKPPDDDGIFFDDERDT